MAADAQPQEQRFGNVTLRPAQRQLLVDGQPAAVGARALDLLLALVERRDRVVTKHELLDLVWPGVVVEENTLQVQIGRLRKLLGPHAIATIPGRGYRFTLPAQAADDRGRLPAPQVEARQTAPAPAPSNLPAELAPLYGRTDDLRALHALIASHRLVTIVGAGGIGKTTFARALAHSQRDQFKDGVWLVELAALNDPELVTTAVASVLGLPLGAEGPAKA